MLSFFDSYALYPQLLVRDEIDIKARNVIYVYKLDIDNSVIDVSFNRYLTFINSPLATSVNYEYDIEAFLDVI